MNTLEFTPVSVSGSRFTVNYQIYGNRKDIKSKAEDICIEQTIEYPLDLVANDGIRQNIVGRIESINRAGRGYYDVEISFADELSGFEIPQILNIIFGNISMKKGIRVTKLQLSRNLLSHFAGPKYGINGIRKILGIERRPILSSAIKPLGLSSGQLASMAYKMALGGLDIVKDDHGIANQSFAPFRERVSLVADAVRDANLKTHGNTLYAPNISGPSDEIFERALFAKSVGATALLVLPGICGFDVARRISGDDSINLPMIMHPAFLGTYVLNKQNGISHFVLHGQLARLIGADLSIIPNYVGRFGYSKEDCHDVANGCKSNMENLKSIFPCVGGGISQEFFSDMVSVYGNDVVFLISGNLHRQGPDLTKNVRVFREFLENNSN